MLRQISDTFLVLCIVAITQVANKVFLMQGRSAFGDFCFVLYFRSPFTASAATTLPGVKQYSSYHVKNRTYINVQVRDNQREGMC